MKKIAYLIGAALMIAGMFASCSLEIRPIFLKRLKMPIRL